MRERVMSDLSPCRKIGGLQAETLQKSGLVDWASTIARVAAGAPRCRFLASRL